MDNQIYPNLYLVGKFHFTAICQGYFWMSYDTIHPLSPNNLCRSSKNKQTKSLPNYAWIIFFFRKLAKLSNFPPSFRCKLRKRPWSSRRRAGTSACAIFTYFLDLLGSVSYIFLFSTGRLVLVLTLWLAGADSRSLVDTAWPKSCTKNPTW